MITAVTISYKPHTEKKELTHGTLQLYDLKRQILETGKTIASHNLLKPFMGHNTLIRKTSMESKIENKPHGK